MSITRKLLRKAMTFALAFALSISMLSVLSVNDASAVSDECKNITYNKNLYDKYQAVCERLVQGLENFEEQIYVGDFNLSREDTPYIIKTVIRKHPELFYTDTSKYMVGTDDANNIMVICPIYLYDKQTAAQKIEVFNANVQKYLSKVDSSMSDFQKAVILHDELILNCTYLDENGTGHVSAYEAIVNGAANCQGYSEAYSYLLALVGVKSEIVESSAMYHIWNKVCIDGEYYNADLTWDDPMPNKQGHVGHKYFLLSDEALCNGDNEISAHYGFDYAYYKSENKKYDNYFYRNIDTRLCFTNDECYMIDNEYQSSYEKCLLKYNYTTNTVELINRFSYKWMSGATSYWKGGYMSLDEYDGILYYNTPDSVYTYNTASGEFSEFAQDVTFSDDCYGLRIIDEKVYAVVNDNPNSEGTLEYAGDCIKETVMLLGDVDGDGFIKITDATEIQKYSADLTDLSDTQLVKADFDKNGVVNVADATAVQKYMIS